MKFKRRIAVFINIKLFCIFRFNIKNKIVFQSPTRCPTAAFKQTRVVLFKHIIYVESIVYNLNLFHLQVILHYYDKLYVE